jgi:hypothetical protein
VRIASKFAALLLMLAVAACDESPVSLPEPASVAVAGSSMSLLVGDAAPVAAQVLDAQGRVMQGLTPVYSTDNPSVATVGADGMVRGVGPGTANVLATYGGSSAAVKVTVAAGSVTVSVAGPAMSLAVGDAAPVAAQVLDRNGRVMAGAALVFSTDNPTVATVGADGMVRGVSPGTANVTAAYGGASATVRVTVTADRRGDLQSLDVLADSVVADRRAGVQTVAIRALNGYGQPVCPRLTLRSSDPSVATARDAGTCRIEIVPSIAGTTTITVAAEGRTDTFLVRVTSTGATSFFSARPTSEQLVAGATVSYTVKVVDQSNRPVAGQAVNFEVGVGSLSANTVVTDSSGNATVRWTIPTHLRELGQTSSITYRTTFQNGQVGGRVEEVFINGASLAEIVLYSGHPYSSDFVRVTADSLLVPAYNYAYVGASGLDQYGNVRTVDFTFSVATGNQPWWWSCGESAGIRLYSGLEYTCIYSYPGTVTVTARAPSGEQRSLRIRYTP